MRVGKIVAISIVSLASLIVVGGIVIAINVFAPSHGNGQQNFAPTCRLEASELGRLCRSFGSRFAASLSDCLELSRAGYGKGRKTVGLFFVFPTTPAAAAGII